MINKLTSLLKRRRIGHLLPLFTDHGITDWSLRDLTARDLGDFGIEEPQLRERLLAAFKKASKSKPPPGTMAEVEGGKMLRESDLWGMKFRTFWMGVYAVTMGEWEKVRNWAMVRNFDMAAGSAPGLYHPVTMINWYDMLKWCNAKSLMESLRPVYEVKGAKGHYSSGEFGEGGASNLIRRARANGYRLPSDPEWEWAASGGINSKGTVFSGSHRLDTVAWYDQNTPDFSTQPVGGKKANELGLYDMNGNVFELCWDLNGSFVRARGGSWRDPRYDCILSDRTISADPSYRADNIGFRLVRNAGSI
jgi:formylglycine-generating enzyme